MVYFYIIVGIIVIVEVGYIGVSLFYFVKKVGEL